METNKGEVDFTIVTASYNYGQYIAECLESVVSQEGVTFEHLIFDGGSNDDTREVVAKFPHVSFVEEPDNGMCDAINKGFRASKGKWVMWLNADDRLRPGALRAFLHFATHNDDADVIYGAWNFINGDGSFKRQMTLFPFRSSMLINLGCYIASTSAFYRRETIIAEEHLLNLNFKYVMDGEYYARLHSLGKKFVYFPRVLAEFRQHGENLSLRNYGKNSIDDWLVLQKQFSETRAIKRAYGVLFTKDENINVFKDTVLYFFWRAAKPILKLIHLSKLEKDSE